MPLVHGGDVGAAVRRFNIPRERWNDISTGISPFSWPVPPVPQHVWRTLPERDLELERAAAAYFGCDPGVVLAVPGSQYALQCLPGLFPRGTVAMPRPGYAEHRQAWAGAGHRVVEYPDAVALHRLVADGVVDHAVLINPNNPTGERVPREAVLALAARIGGNGGCLLVDEAFADVYEEVGVASRCPQPGLVVLRSLGKFFGLAGLRLGFVLAEPVLCRALDAVLPPWSVSHPARWIGTRALWDTGWQAAQRARLLGESRRWSQRLRDVLPAMPLADAVLFQSVLGEPPYCRALYEALGRRAVLVRLLDTVDDGAMLRFGLPAPEQQAPVLEALRASLEECACAVS